MKRDRVGERLELFEEDSFSLISPSMAGWLLVAALFMCLLFDRLGWLAK